MINPRLLSFGLFIALGLNSNVVWAARDLSVNPNSALVATAIGIFFWFWVVFVTLRTILRNPVRGTGLVLGILTTFLIVLLLPVFIVFKFNISGFLTIMVFIACFVLAYLWLNLMEKMFPELGRREL